METAVPTFAEKQHCWGWLSTTDILAQLNEAGHKLLETAQRKRIDETEAYLVSNRVLTVRLVNNAVFEVKGVHDIGIGLRVIKGNMLGFSSTADLSSKSLEKLVDSANATAKARILPFKYTFPRPGKKTSVVGVHDKKLENIPSEEVVDLAYGMVEASLAYDRKVKDNAGVLNIVSYRTITMNTNGVHVNNRGTFFEASLSATAKSGSAVSEGSNATAGRNLKELKTEDVGKHAAEMSVTGLKTEKLQEGNYTVILDHEPSQELLSYVSTLVSPMYARLYYPLFLGKTGKKIASTDLTLIDDPLMPRGVGSEAVDDEGTPSKKKVIIQKGILKDFVYDSFYAAIEKKRTTGNAVRASLGVGVSSFPGKNYNGEPIPVCRNPYFLPGRWKRDEIIEDTKKGFLVQRFHYTRLTNPTRGDFTSVLRMGLQMVKNGEMTGAVKKSRLLDNLLNMLHNVDAVSDKLAVAGTWGSYAQTPIIRTKARVVPVD